MIPALRPLAGAILIASAPLACFAQGAPTPSPAAGAAAEASPPPVAAPASPAAAPTPVDIAADGTVPPPPPGKAEVVFFRESAMHGALVWYIVRENGLGLGKLTNGKYFAVVVDPGPHQFTAATENQTKLKMEADPGEIYYIEGKIHMGLLVGEPSLQLANDFDFKHAFPHMHPAKPLTAEETGPKKS